MLIKYCVKKRYFNTLWNTVTRQRKWKKKEKECVEKFVKCEKVKCCKFFEQMYKIFTINCTINFELLTNVLTNFQNYWLNLRLFIENLVSNQTFRSIIQMCHFSVKDEISKSSEFHTKPLWYERKQCSIFFDGMNWIKRKTIQLIPSTSPKYIPNTFYNIFCDSYRGTHRHAYWQTS